MIHEASADMRFAIPINFVLVSSSSNANIEVGVVEADAQPVRSHDECKA